MQPRFYNEQGVLDPNGRYARVSTILATADKPELDWNNLQLAAAEGLDAVIDRRENASERGRSVHDACEHYVKHGEVVVLNEEQEGYFRGFRLWYEKEQPTDCQTEVFIASKEHNYAGRTDLVCKLWDEWWIVDIKTSKRQNPVMGLQLAAYRQAWFELTGIEPKTAILQLVPELKRGYRFTEYDEQLRPFLALQEYYNWCVSKQKKRIVEESTWDGHTIALEEAA